MSPPHIQRRSPVDGLALVTGFVGPFLTVFGITVLVPIYPSIARQLGVGAGDIAAVPTAGYLAVLLFVTAWGWLAERIDLVRLFVAGVALWLLGAVAQAFALAEAWFQFLVVGRFVQGIGEAGLYLLALAIVRQRMPGAARYRGAGRLEIGSSVGGVLGPLAGSLFAGRIILVFGISIVLSAVAVALVLVADRGSRRYSSNLEIDRSDSDRGLSYAGRRHEKPLQSVGVIVVSISFLGAVIFFLFGVVLVFSGYLAESFGFRGEVAGPVAMAGQIILVVSSVLAGRYSIPRIGSTRLLALSTASLSSLVVALAIAPTFPMAVLFFLLFFAVLGHAIPSGSSAGMELGRSWAITAYMFARSAGQYLSTIYLGLMFSGARTAGTLRLILRDTYLGAALIGALPVLVAATFLLLRWRRLPAADPK